MQSGLDDFASGGLQVDARLYAMAVGYTLGKNAAAAAAAAGGGCCRQKWARGAVMASLVGVAVAVVVTVAKRSRA